MDLHIEVPKTPPSSTFLMKMPKVVKAQELSKRAWQEVRGPDAQWHPDSDDKYQIAVTLGWLLQTTKAAQPTNGLEIDELMCVVLLQGVEHALELDPMYIHDEFGQRIEMMTMELDALHSLEDEGQSTDEAVTHYEDASEALQTVFYIRLAVNANFSLPRHGPEKGKLLAIEGQRMLRRMERGNHRAHQYAYALLLLLENASRQLLGEGGAD